MQDFSAYGFGGALPVPSPVAVTKLTSLWFGVGSFNGTLPAAYSQLR